MALQALRERIKRGRGGAQPTNKSLYWGELCGSLKIPLVGQPGSTSATNNQVSLHAFKKRRIKTKNINNAYRK